MTAADALVAARTAGIRIELDGNHLLLEADGLEGDPPTDLLRRHKAGILTILRRRGSWTVEDWQVDLNERAAIAEFDGGLPRGHAEALALAYCVAEGLDPASLAGGPEAICRAWANDVNGVTYPAMLDINSHGCAHVG